MNAGDEIIFERGGHKRKVRLTARATENEVPGWNAVVLETTNCNDPLGIEVFVPCYDEIEEEAP